eukprot:6609343-Pyramimonas_sp.AAC.1
MRFKDPTGYESIIGDAEDHPEKDDEQMKKEPVETQPVEVQADSGAASSRDGPRGVAEGVSDQTGAP